MDRNRQKGEGKIGCVGSLLVFIIMVAAGWQIIPVLFSNNSLESACEAVGGRAVQLNQETILVQIRDKAKELAIPEAMVPGAITVSKQGKDTGVCLVTLKYKRKVDLYGIYSFDIKTDKKLSIPFMDSTQ